MIKALVKIFIKTPDDIKSNKVREKYCFLSGILGIILNLILFITKLTLGILSGSVAIMSDGFNNLSDMGSSVISIIGIKLSNRHADKEHPFGHGRIEYISALIVSFIIILMGFELAKSSINKIIFPVKPAFNPVLVIILIISVSIKLWMFSYNRYIGKKISSKVISAASTDSLNDVFATTAVLFSLFLGNYFNLPIDGIAGLLVSVMIVCSGYQISRDTIGSLLGGPPDPQMVKEINEIILNQEGIIGTHDLIIHDYGPGRIMASVHAEVPDDAEIVKIHDVIDKVEREIWQNMDVHIVIHTDPISINSKRTNTLKQIVQRVVLAVDPTFNIHDFRVSEGEENINIIFDLEIPCGKSIKQKEMAVENIKKRLKEIDFHFQAFIQVDDIF